MKVYYNLLYIIYIIDITNVLKLIIQMSEVVVVFTPYM